MTIAFPAEADTAEGRFGAFTAAGAPLVVALSLRFEVSNADLPRFQAAVGGNARGHFVPLLKSELRLAAAEQSIENLDGPRLAETLATRMRPSFNESGARLLSIEVTTLAAPGREALPTGGANPFRGKVLLVGIDAADWTIIDRLRSEGQLPVLSMLVERGASGPLRSIEPLLSPLIWTTIATGVSPARHGILDFMVNDPATGKSVPATSRLRRVPAFWNRASSAGRSSGIIGWLATWPAESIEGFIVTDRFGFLAFAGKSATTPDADVIYPADLLEGHESLAVASEAVTDAMVRRYLDVPPAEIKAARRGGYEKGNRINNFIHTLATAESYAALGLELYRTRRPDVMAVYFEFIDATGHLFMPFAPPLMPGVAADDGRRFGHAVREAYRRQDEMLGRFIEAADESTLIMVVSDHGFRSGQARLSGSAEMEEADAARWHLLDGVVILAGPGVKPGAALTSATVYDIAPTLLARLGLPLPDELEGRPLTEAFQPGTLFDGHAARPPGRDPVAGIVSADDQHAPADARSLVNLGIVLAKEGRMVEAETAFRRALAADPADRTAVANLAAVLLKREDYASAETLLVRLLSADPGYALGWDNLAVCYQRQGRHDEALANYGRAIQLQPNDQRVRMNRGFLLLEMQRPVDAEMDFRASLAVAAREPGALYGLAAALEQQGRLDEAREQAFLARALAPDHPGVARLIERLTAAKKSG